MWGPNVGVLAIAAACYVGDTGRVLAFEPHPQIFRYLSENVSINALRNVKLFQCAVGAEAGTTGLTDDISDDQNFVVTDSALKVPRRTLDESVPPELEIALLKIDVEGYECFVLEGAESTLSRTTCVFIEAWDELTLRYGYRAADVLEMLRRKGFHVFRHDPAGGLLDEIGTDVGSRLANYLAMRNPLALARRLGLDAAAALQP